MGSILNVRGLYTTTSPFGYSFAFNPVLPPIGPLVLFGAIFITCLVVAHLIGSRREPFTSQYSKNPLRGVLDTKALKGFLLGTVPDLVSTLSVTAFYQVRSHYGKLSVSLSSSLSSQNNSTSYCLVVAAPL